MTTLAEFLATNDASCPRCGHGLRGLAEARCPECGLPIELGVCGVGEAASGSWLSALIGANLGTGAGAGMGGYMLLVRLNGGVFPLWYMAGFTMIAMAGVGATIGLLRVRRRWGTHPGRVRTAVAVLVWVAAAAGPAGMLFLISL